MIDIPHLKTLLGKASPGMAFYEERNEKLKNELRANAAELIRLAELGKIYERDQECQGH